MSTEVIKDMLDWLRICRDEAILEDDEETAVKLSDLILLAAGNPDEKSVLNLIENAVEEITPVDYLKREVRILRPMLSRLQAV